LIIVTIFAVVLIIAIIILTTVLMEKKLASLNEPKPKLSHNTVQAWVFESRPSANLF
jgi:hypothetical protein